MRYDPQEIDFSKPYKTFNDLSEGDKVFMYDIENNEVYECNVDKYEQEDASSYYDKNRKKVKLLVNKTGVCSFSLDIYDGNTFISMYHNGEIFAITDERIVEQIKYIIMHRNQYQWSTIMKVFGRPLDGYAKQPVILG